MCFPRPQPFRWHRCHVWRCAILRRCVAVVENRVGEYAMRRNAYGVYLLLSGLSAAFFYLYGAVAAVYRVSTAGLSPLQLVLVGTALEAACFVVGVPTGILADVLSRRLLVVIGFLLEGIGFALEGAIPQ